MKKCQMQPHATQFHCSKRDRLQALDILRTCLRPQPVANTSSALYATWSFEDRVESLELTHKVRLP